MDVFSPIRISMPYTPARIADPIYMSTGHPPRCRDIIRICSILLDYDRTISAIDYAFQHSLTLTTGTQKACRRIAMKWKKVLETMGLWYEVNEMQDFDLSQQHWQLDIEQDEEDD
jgi:hypothetical protein